MMRDVEIVAVCYIFIGIFGVIGNGMIVISLGKVSNKYSQRGFWLAYRKMQSSDWFSHIWNFSWACFLKISSMTEGKLCTVPI